jgi:hypothetical protein
MRSEGRQSKPITHLISNMDVYYDIPYDVPKRINSDIPDLVRKSTLHSMQLKDRESEQNGNWLFRIPYHEGAFWTNIKYVCHGIEQQLEIGIIAYTEDGKYTEILPMEPRLQATWHDTKWPIPSLNLGHGQLYLVIKPVDHNPDMQYLRIKILGFTDLFPNADYELVGEDLHPHLLFRNDQEDTTCSIQLPSKETIGMNPQKIRLIQDY